MKIVSLYSKNHTHDYVLSQLQKKYGDDLYKIEETQDVQDAISRVLKRKNTTIISKINVLLFFIYYFLLLKRKIDTHLIKSLHVKSSIGADLKVKNINDPRALEKIKELNPDIILVSGTSILKRPWLELETPIINAHTGIVPEYRGRFCWFWPIVNEQYNMLGVTAHLIDAGVDSGEILAQLFVEQAELSNFKIHRILEVVAKSICPAFETAITNLKSKDRESNFHTNNTDYRIYLEPGITDYFRFIKNRYRYMKR